MWKCRCDCGNEVIVDDNGLTTGSTQSCGCLQRELQSKKMKKYNEYDLSGEYGIGYTNNCNEEGINYFYFDLEDYDKIKDYCWCFNNTGYIQAKTLDGSGKHILMHRLLYPESYQIDHIKHILYDNRKSQLRIVTNGQNQMNKGLQKNNNSGVTGVSWHKRDNIWEARITLNKKQIYLGRFEKFEDAIKARKEAEEKYFGEYAYDYSQAL